MINNFIKKTFFTLLSFSIVLILLFLVTLKIVKKNSFIELDKDINSIVLGNSRPEASVSDSIIKEFKNFSLSGESYFYTYSKLKKIVLKNEKSLKFVFIEISIINVLEHRFDNGIWSDKYMLNFLPANYAFLKVDDLRLLIKKNSKVFMKASIVSFRENILKILLNDYQLYNRNGGFKRVYRQNLDSLIVSNYNFINEKFGRPKIFNESLDYLEKIIKLCNNNDIKVFLIRTPLYKNHDLLQLEETITDSILKTRFSHVEFIDFKDFSLEDGDYADFIHLNYKGAKKFSVFFNTLLKQKIILTQNN